MTIYTLRLDSRTSRDLTYIGHRLARKRCDALRLLIRETAKDLRQSDTAASAKAENADGLPDAG